MKCGPAGCAACHTAEGGPELAGGHAFATPFGTFYSSNITPDPKTGIGGWSDEDLIRALRDGVGPDGRHYFPAFPYTSYTLMADDDIRALKAYLDTVPPVSSAVADWPPIATPLAQVCSATAQATPLAGSVMPQAALKPP